MEEIAFYSSQSKITDPGEYLSLFAVLPVDIVSLVQIVQGLIIQENDGQLFDYVITKQRHIETNLRYVKKMLAQIVALDKRDLTTVREPAQRLVGTCRDFALLLCAMLRYHQIPARIRVGFARYIYPNTNFNSDHVVLEYWNANAKEWHLIDPRISAFHIAKKRFQIDFDVFNVPRTQFISAGNAWLACQSGAAQADQYGFGLINRINGLWYIRNKIMQDLAALNKHEPLLWDVWGFMRQQASGVAPNDSQKILFNQLASKINKNHKDSFAQLQLYYKNKNLAMPKQIIACSPTLGEHAVTLED